MAATTTSSFLLQAAPPAAQALPLHVSRRRRIDRDSGRALEILAHAIEYLADEYAHESGSISSIHSRDPRVEAMQLLMAANRQVYYACPVMPSLYQRIVGRLFGG